MNYSLFSPLTQTETPKGVNASAAKKRKSPRQELAVAPKVAAIVNLLL